MSTKAKLNKLLKTKEDIKKAIQNTIIQKS